MVLMAFLVGMVTAIVFSTAALSMSPHAIWGGQWYIKHTVDKRYIYGGPYPNEAACLAALPGVRKAYPNVEIRCQEE